jgi:predicted PolB exonuclease-like 3'-5' exonuclease
VIAGTAICHPIYFWIKALIPILVFDIETIPDIQGIRTLYGLDHIFSDDDVLNAANYKRRQKNGSDYLQHHLQKIVAISCVLRKRDQLKIWTLGDINDSEEEIIKRFFDGVDKYTPTLVSWNGSGFDLPVLNYRALIYGINASKYLDMGEIDKDFKWNNYLSRYHSRHTDLMEFLAMFQSKNNAPLNDIAKLCGFPGKLSMDGEKVWDAYREGGIQSIRDYCETDVANTYLIYLKLQLIRGSLNQKQYEAEKNLVKNTIQEYQKEYWNAFLSAWKS